MEEKRPTEYKVGDTLYERKVVRDENYKVVRIVREWTVLSVVVDALYTDEEGAAQQVVTLRAFTDKRALYEAEIAALIDISVEEGLWRRTREEAESGWLEESRLRRDRGVLMLDLGLGEKVPAEVLDHRGEE